VALSFPLLLCSMNEKWVNVLLIFRVSKIFGFTEYKRPPNMSRLVPYEEKYLTILKNFFFELDEPTQRKFWVHVGETDERLTDEKWPKPAHCVQDQAYEGTQITFVTLKTGKIIL